MAAKTIRPSISTPKRDFHFMGTDSWCFGSVILGVSSTLLIVVVAASPKVDSLYFPSGVLETSSPRFSRW